jgi:hypothetical protein
VTVFGALVTLWCLADAHANENGVLTGYTCDDVDALVAVPGFCSALPSDWIDTSGEFVKLPDYQEHNGTTGKTRAQDAKRQKRHRDVTDASRDDRDEKRTRGEERREEEKEKKERTPRQPKTKSEETTLRQWVEALAGADAVPADDPIFDWAGKQGIPGDWIGYAWAAFEDRYADKDRRYTDWRAAFRDHVKRGWLDIWRVDQRNGGFVLTTAGEQWRREVTA